MPRRHLLHFGFATTHRGTGSSSLRPLLRVCCLAVVCASVGCSGFARRWQRDDVVSARQVAQRGMDALDAGNWQRAEEYFGEAVEVCPEDERVRSRYADALWNRGARSEAMLHMREAVRLSGGDPKLLVRLGEMYLQQGEWQQAEQLADRALRSGRQSADAYRLRGDVFAQKRQWRLALADYHRALSIQSQYPEVQMAVARVYLQRGRPQRTLSTLQNLAGAYPSGEEPADILYWEGLAYKSLGRYEEAVHHLARAEERGMQSADLLYHLAESHHLAGNSLVAERVIQRALDLDPAHVAARQLSPKIRNALQMASLRK